MKKVIKIEILTMKYKDKKALEKEIGCTFISIDPHKEDCNIFKALNEIHRHIKKSTKQLTEKCLVYELSNKLLRLEFKSNNSINVKYLKHVVKHIFLTL